MTITGSPQRLGFLADLLGDPTVEEIIVIGGHRTFVVRNGVKELVPIVADTATLRRFADQLLAGTGRRLDLSSPIVSAQLADGSRVHITGPPVTHPDRLNIQIRKFVVTATGLDELVERETLTPASAELLRQAMRRDLSVVVAGAPGAGKTTLVNCLLREVPPDRRVVTCEEVFEIDADLPDMTQMQTRESGLDGGAEITLRDLVREALRQRPDRIVVGEVRGPEALLSKPPPLNPGRESVSGRHPRTFGPPHGSGRVERGRTPRPSVRRWGQRDGSVQERKGVRRPQAPTRYSKRPVGLLGGVPVPSRR